MEKAGSWKDFMKAELHFSIVSHCCLSYCESTLKFVFRENNFLLYTLIVLLKTEAKFLIICSLFTMYLHGEIVFFWIFFFWFHNLYVTRRLTWVRTGHAPCLENQASGTQYTWLQNEFSFSTASQLYRSSF